MSNSLKAHMLSSIHDAGTTAIFLVLSAATGKCCWLRGSYTMNWLRYVKTDSGSAWNG